MRMSFISDSKQARELAAGEQAAAAEVDVEEAEQLAAGQPPAAVLELVEQPGAVAAADDGAHGRSGDDVGLHAKLVEGAQHADVRPAARGAAAQRQSDQRPSLPTGGRLLAVLLERVSLHLAPSMLRGLQGPDPTAFAASGSAAFRAAHRLVEDQREIGRRRLAGRHRAIEARTIARCGRRRRRRRSATLSRIASWSQSTRISATASVLPLSSPLRHSFLRDRLQNQPCPVSMVRASASAFMWATISTSPLSASTAIATIRPSASNFGASSVPVSTVSSSGRAAKGKGQRSSAVSPSISGASG